MTEEDKKAEEMYRKMDTGTMKDWYYLGKKSNNDFITTLFGALLKERAKGNI